MPEENVTKGFVMSDDKPKIEFMNGALVGERSWTGPYPIYLTFKGGRGPCCLSLNEIDAIHKFAHEQAEKQKADEG
jgi:hypothetical protein